MDNTKDINRWIEFAFVKGVKRLDLNFAETDTRFKFEESPQYTFPDIYHWRLFELTWESLVSLRLTEVCVFPDFLASFISNCPFLEELHVENPIGFYSFKTSPQMIRLKRLVIITSDSFSRLVLCSPSLVSCTLVLTRREDFKIQLKDVSSLASLSLGRMWLGPLSDCLCDMSECFSSLETLSLRPMALSGLDRYRRYPVLPGLKKLVLDVDPHHSGNLLFFTPLLDAAPSLREIVMKVEFSPLLALRRGRRPEKGIEHQCLQVFEIEGYASVKACPELIIYVLENASSFQRLIINGKVVTGDVLDLLKSKLDSETCVEDVTHIVFPNGRGSKSMNDFNYQVASR
ncbi:hypothetical protein PHJA_002665500 [Phtheirospermum japonicum]|uniref:At1g61320/AtMIF1 LRR domain-containing protein n=1 Tax=Phtheirospermum japonicum TaxID=374723 RepID=A0A830DAP1_9LAMI|nr:hypothetical protein PHJA_002665500 [Phtheirospermum japonicum]